MTNTLKAVKGLAKFKEKEMKLFFEAPADTGNWKSIYVTLQGRFKVFIDNKEIFDGLSPEQAVESFNAEG